MVRGSFRTISTWAAWPPGGPGGAWIGSGTSCRATYRDFLIERFNFVGFRLVRVRIVEQPGPLGMKFVPLPKATFYMGGGGGKAGKKTEIKEAFEIAIHEVTQGQWQEVMGNNPSRFSRTGAWKGKVKDIKEEDLKHFPVEMCVVERRAGVHQEAE